MSTSAMGGGTPRVRAWSLCLLFVASCELVPEVGKDEGEAGEDGELCDNADDCRSGICTTAQLCAHSACRCTGDSCGAAGKPSEACNDGWVCTDATNVFDDVREFFGGEAPEDRGYCQAPCELGCPEHYTCSGSFCRPDVDWADPIPTITWSGAASGSVSGRNQMPRVDLEEGASVLLRASAESPTDVAIQSYRWTWSSSRESGEAEGSELQLALHPDASFVRAELAVTDERARTSLTSVVFDACFGAGATCGYEGSGCCNGCDRAANTCL